MKIGTRFGFANTIIIFILVITSFASISIFSREHQHQITEDAHILVQQIVNAIQDNIEFFPEDMELFWVTLNLSENGP